MTHPPPPAYTEHYRFPPWWATTLPPRGTPHATSPFPAPHLHGRTDCNLPPPRILPPLGPTWTWTDGPAVTTALTGPGFADDCRMPPPPSPTTRHTACDTWNLDCWFPPPPAPSPAAYTVHSGRSPLLPPPPRTYGGRLPLHWLQSDLRTFPTTAYTAILLPAAHAHAPSCTHLHALLPFLRHRAAHHRAPCRTHLPTCRTHTTPPRVLPPTCYPLHLPHTRPLPPALYAPATQRTAPARTPPPHHTLPATCYVLNTSARSPHTDYLLPQLAHSTHAYATCPTTTTYPLPLRAIGYPHTHLQDGQLDLHTCLPRDRGRATTHHGLDHHHATTTACLRQFLPPPHYAAYPSHHTTATTHAPLPPLTTRAPSSASSHGRFLLLPVAACWDTPVHFLLLFRLLLDVFTTTPAAPRHTTFNTRVPHPPAPPTPRTGCCCSPHLPLVPHTTLYPHLVIAQKVTYRHCLRRTPAPPAFLPHALHTYTDAVPAALPGRWHYLQFYHGGRHHTTLPPRYHP